MTRERSGEVRGGLVTYDPREFKKLVSLSGSLEHLQKPAGK